jgi:proline iminopeptidase
MQTERRKLYPALAPYATGRLKVSGRHEIYYEQSGRADGQPVVFLHGGPGGGADARVRRFFDPAHYRIVVFDQRGCGRSTPHACLEDNTTWDLCRDIEQLRTTLDIPSWLVFGGSWGSTLALAYAQTYPEAVTGLILRGIFLGRQKEFDWFYRHGTSEIFPDDWERFMTPLSPAERSDPLAAYHRILNGEDADAALAAARAWSIWEASVSMLFRDDSYVAHFNDPHAALALAKIECHYFVNRVFMDHDDQLLDGVAKIRHLPGFIVQGRYDVICAPRTAWELHQAWPEARLSFVPDAGHSAFEPGIVDALVTVTDDCRGLA